MDGVIQIAGVVILFILRLLVPLAITFAVGYWLRKLDAKWQAEAEARQKSARVAQQPILIQPEPQFAADIGQLIRERCWDIHQCSGAKRAQCPASIHPDMPCWQARQQVEGELPAKCPNCKIYVQGQNQEPTQPSVRH